jgi:hypothetical protein
MKDMIKITGVDLVKFAQKVYELSGPIPAILTKEAPLGGDY